MAEFSEVKRIKRPRKRYTCEACGCDVTDDHFVHRWTDGGKWHTTRVCVGCQHLMNRLLEVSGHDSVQWYDLHGEAEQWGLA